MKISKAEAGYQYRPGVEYRCGECTMTKALPNGRLGCAWYGRSAPVSANAGSCNYFAHGESRIAVPWLGLFNKGQLGYMENPGGFSCKRCEHFSISKLDCERVNRRSPGDTAGRIDPGGCCNLWRPDPKRAPMASPALIRLVAAAHKGKQVQGLDRMRS
jgi:hypothetical protein